MPRFIEMKWAFPQSNEYQSSGSSFLGHLPLAIAQISPGALPG